jgi:ribonucleoside-diphosphate reductase alpha chain
MAQRFLPAEERPGQVAAPATGTELESEADRTDSERAVYIAQADAPPCHECGAIMIRNAACYACVNCGATSGCS